MKYTPDTTAFEDLFDVHAGETCVLSGNGITLKDVPKPLFKKYKTIGTNRVYLPGGYVPNYHVTVNPLVLDQFYEEIDALKCDAKFVREGYQGKVKGAYGLIDVAMQTFSFNPAAYIWEGFTVTYAALQIAYFMGFETVLLVGVDHDYKYNGNPNEMRVLKGEDPNHFNPDYFKDAQWHNPDLKNSEIAYTIAQDVFQNSGRRIVNLTPNTKLNVFEKGAIGGWLL